MTNKKFILKPGNHQFVPGSHPIHNNENLDDEEAAWYLKAYPHIANLFEQIPTREELIEINIDKEMRLLRALEKTEDNSPNPKTHHSPHTTHHSNEDVFTTN